MRAAAILGLGCSPRALDPFQRYSNATWTLGLPASATEADAILIFGGDGTIHRHLHALVKLNRPVLIVPTGSGNDFARALKLRSLKDSLAAWRKFEEGLGNTWAIDLGVIRPLEASSVDASEAPRSHYFCCVAGCGLDAEVARRANALPRWVRAHGGYVLSLPAAMRAYNPARMKLAVSNPGNELTPHSDKPTLVIAFANAPAYGDGMRIAPRARLDDGLLDVCRIDRISNLKLARLFPTVFFGKHLGIPEVEYFQTDRLRLETERPLDVYADGEYVCRTPINAEVAPRALTVIVLAPLVGSTNAPVLRRLTRKK